jgi:multicomponent Na+:H+ antiporter subunit D
MSAPVFWIVLPVLVGVLALFIRNHRILTFVGGSVTILLTLVALLVPIDQAMQLGQLSFKINSSIDVLGRRIILTPAHGALLAILYGLTAMWLIGSDQVRGGDRLVPLGLIITALFVASSAVQPFLYAALLIEMAVLISIPMLLGPKQAPGPGLMRFLIYNTLAMPFILFAGWMLSGVESSPGDLALVAQSAIILGLGFAFLFAIFPLYTWLPMLAEEANPYLVGFIFWILPTSTTIFGMGFLDRYSWIRNSPQLPVILQAAGLLMVVTGGLWSAFQKHLGRQMAYGTVTEIGFNLLALSLGTNRGIQIAFMLIIPRSLALMVWALALSKLKEIKPSLRYRDIQGLAKIYPLTSAGLILAHLSTAGLPLLASFPVRLALWDSLASQSLNLALWVLVGILGLMVGAVRSMAVLVMSPEIEDWQFLEQWKPGILIGAGILLLMILGIFPQSMQIILKNLPSIFEHLTS